MARSQEFFLAVKAYLLARVFAEVTKERVDAYIDPIFARYKFPVHKEWQARAGEFVTKRSSLYLADLDSPLVAQYDAECEAAHRAHGWTGKDGSCPECCADFERVKAENRLIDIACRTLAPGKGSADVHGDVRKNMLRLLSEIAVTEYGKDAFRLPQHPV